MPFILFAVLLLGLDLIVYQSVQLAIYEFSQPVKLGIGLAYWSIPVGLVLWWINSNNRTQNTPFRAVFFIIYFAKVLFLFLTLLLQLGVFLLHGLAYFIPIFEISKDSSSLIAQLGILITGIPMCLMIYGIFRNRHRYKIYEVEVPIEGLTESLDGLRIVQISDIHSGSFTKKEPIKKGINLINRVEADLVFFTGDLVNSIATEIEPYIQIFNKISAKYGVYSVLGNHDYGDYVRWSNQEMKISNLKRLIQTQKEMGWQLLMNENRLLTINGEKVAIIGVENYSASPRFSKYGNLEQAYRGADSAGLKLLLSHDPSHWLAEVTKHFSDINITFSGHTHGAQFGIEIAGLLKWSPVQYFYKQWAGLYREGKQFLYVNRGFGYLGYPGRVGILPEITLMTLKRAKS